MKCELFGKKFLVNKDLRPPYSDEVIRRSGISKISNVLKPSLAIRLYDGYFDANKSPEGLLEGVVQSRGGGDIRTLQTALGKISALKWEEFKLNPIVPSLLGHRVGDKVYRYLLVDITEYHLGDKTLFEYIAMDYDSGIVLAKLEADERENEELVSKMLEMVKDNWDYYPDVVVSDDSPAIIAAREKVFPLARHQFDHDHYKRKVRQAIWKKKGENALRKLETPVRMKRRRFGHLFQAIMDINERDEAERERKHIEEMRGILEGDDVLKPLGNELLDNWDNWTVFLDHTNLPGCPYSSNKIEGNFGDLDKRKSKSKAKVFRTWGDEVTGWIVKHNKRMLKGQLDRREKEMARQAQELKRIETRKKTRAEFKKYERELMDLVKKKEMTLEEFAHRIELRSTSLGLGDDVEEPGRYETGPPPGPESGSP